MGKAHSSITRFITAGPRGSWRGITLAIEYNTNNQPWPLFESAWRRAIEGADSWSLMSKNIWLSKSEWIKHLDSANTFLLNFQLQQGSDEPNHQCAGAEWLLMPEWYVMEKFCPCPQICFVVVDLNLDQSLMMGEGMKTVPRLSLRNTSTDPFFIKERFQMFQQNKMYTGHLM